MARRLWFRLWTEAKNDAKLDALSDAEFRLWFKLLCLAAESGGAADYSEPEWLAVEMRCQPDDLAAAIERMKRLRLVAIDGESVVFPSFAERQYAKDSDNPEAVRDRVARHREKQRNADVTRCNADVTRCNAEVTPTQNRTEQNKTEQNRAEPREAAPVDNPRCFTEADTERLWSAFTDKFPSDSGRFDAFLSGIASRCPKRCNGIHRCGVEFGLGCIQRARAASGAVKFAREDGR